MQVIINLYFTVPVFSVITRRTLYFDNKGVFASSVCLFVPIQ